MKDHEEDSPIRWNQIKEELKSALSTFEELSLKQNGMPPSDEKKLQEMKELLREIKSKISDLSKP
jgi:hypothetical protein